ncbi:hypothetical protein SAMN02799624_05384 [Paenibacillus sp. UNC496MF]|uniref:hypothetical protein n=1 Tax=Paenibacillus sp. UNC496MF TaxID=1502753 RepID=UPI0008F07866|nr:hypothetical protein [Paenibacillus sp. UNC496MF]SFJ65170.1 hypothetical protein SAMN02799624_05384 [Paenibacillus sp. UNC496MF]
MELIEAYLHQTDGNIAEPDEHEDLERATMEAFAENIIKNCRAKLEKEWHKRAYTYDEFCREVRRAALERADEYTRLREMEGANTLYLEDFVRRLPIRPIGRFEGPSIFTVVMTSLSILVIGGAFTSFFLHLLGKV